MSKNQKKSNVTKEEQLAWREYKSLQQKSLTAAEYAELEYYTKLNFTKR